MAEKQVLERIRLGEVEQVRSDAQMPFTFDGSLGTLRQPDGSIRFWETDLGTKPYYFLFRGTERDPLREREGSFTWDYNGYSDRWPNGIWVQGLYQVEGDLLVGFCHREFFSNPRFDADGVLAGHTGGHCNSYHIGFAISEDGGLHWKYVGDVCSNVCNHGDCLANVGGVPFLVVDGWFYLYFNEYVRPDERYVSVARCRVDETVRALRAGRLPVVRKYSGNGRWDADGMNGVGAPVVPISPGCDAHSDAAYCAPLDRYLLTVQTHGTGRLLLYLSEDGVHWFDCIVLDTVEENSCMHPYSTFVDASSDASADMSTVGRDFYVYFPRKSLRDYGLDTWYRRKVTIVD